MAWYDKWAVMVIAAAVGVASYNCIRWAELDATILAYWVQAIGSIAAIYWAARIASRQAHTARIDRKRAHLETAMATLLIAGRFRDEAIMAAEDAKDAIIYKSGGPLIGAKDRVERVHTQIEMLLKNNVNSDVLSIVLRIHSQTGIALRNIEAVIGDGSNRDNHKESASKVVSSLNSISSDLAACTQRIAIELAKIY